MDIPRPVHNRAVEHLADEFLRTGCLPTADRADGSHLVTAAAEVDYLLRWYCWHLANVQILRRPEAEAKRVGWVRATPAWAFYGFKPAFDLTFRI
ncbi:MAG: hypothetical protein NT154_26940 [Verrucomicrobia bacterium]|nr:hypothetical protein [Verrucomicrobiota bacterium]